MKEKEKNDNGERYEYFVCGRHNQTTQRHMHKAIIREHRLKLAILNTWFEL